MRYNESVTIRNTATAAANEQPPKVNECAAIDCNRRIRVAYNCRMLLPLAQDRHDDVQRTYTLQHKGIHRYVMPSSPNRIKLNPARKAGTQASVCVSSVIKVKSQSNSIQPAGKQHTHRYHSVIRVPCAVRHSDWHSKDVGCRR